MRSSEPVRIAYVISTFYPFVGGGETHARHLCAGMKKRGVDVFVITRRTGRELAEEERVDGVRVIRVPPTASGRLGKYGMLFPVYRRLIRMREEYDLVVVSGLRLLGVPAMLAARRLGKRCILRAASCGELSGGFIWDSPHLAGRARRKGLWPLLVSWRNRLLLKADGFLGISKVIGEEYRSCGVADDKIKVINNGTETDRFHPVGAAEKSDLRAKLQLPGEKVLFAYAGKLNRGKGLLFLARVWKRITLSRDDLHLVLIGSGQGSFLSCEDELRSRLRDAGIEQHVTITGYTDAVNEYLQASDVFVFPSENESLSNALIEALACGLPCLASNVGGIPDTVQDGENGMLLPVGDEGAWAAAIEEMGDNSERRLQWGQAGRERVMRRNSMARVVDAHLEFFGEVCGTGGGPVMRIPFQERKSRFRALLDLATGAYPAFCFGGPLGRGVPVFHFHDVAADYLAPYLRHLAENGYRTITSQAMGRCVRGGQMPEERTVALCFDDAWASLASVVVPLLKEHGLTAIAYVVPGRVAEKPGGKLASWGELEQVRDSGVVDLQAHTYSHAMMFCDSALCGFVEPNTRITYLSLPAMEFKGSPRFLSLDMLGAPLYPRRSRMSDARWYQDARESREACIEYVRGQGGEKFFEKPDWRERLQELAASGDGAFETDEEQRQAIRGELLDAREVLSAKLGQSTVRQVCMPWGICGKVAESLLEETGYETAVADRLYGRRIITGKQNPFRIMRLKHRYILRLPRR